MLPMNSSSRFLILLTLPPIVSLGVGAKWAATRARASQVQTQEIEVIDAPDRWVPFSADVTIKTHGTDVVGRFYRAADGSRRIETGPARDDIRVISIVNTSKGNGYDYSPGRGWRVFLVPNISPGNYHPVRWKKNIPGWSIYPYRLAVRQGQSGSLMAAEGFLAYEVRVPMAL